MSLTTGSGCDQPVPAVRAPFPVTSPYRVVPAPRPLRGEPHVVLDGAWPAALARRLERLRHDLPGVVVHEPGGPRPGLDDALRRAWSLLPGTDHLGVTVDLDTCTATRTRPLQGPAGQAQELLLGLGGTELLVVGWLLACSDDLVVLRRTGEQSLAAELLAVCFPSGWPVRERAGAALHELHGPVADGDRLRRAGPALSQALLTQGPFVQHVWGLNPSGRLDRDPTAPDREAPSCPAPERWWLRVERQTTLPLGDRALFLIRPYLTPLTALTGEQRDVLRAAVASMSPESLAYKGITEVADRLLAWLQRSAETPG
ncbi:MAG: heme-dependent oxidative N-demethylase subunit alpha family protein [Mycobacteriales bacterium]